MKQRGVSFVDHYIDNFVTLGAPLSTECATNLQIMVSTCKDTGTPVESDKTEGPSTTITFLVIEKDSIAMELRLPADKLARLIQLSTRWRGKKECRKRELLSLIGILNHACKVIKAGRSFLRRLIDLSKLVKHPDYFLRLNRQARSDIEWWHLFASSWNGVSMMFTANRHLYEKSVVSDASGKWGCGAFSEDKWFQLRWPAGLQDCHITVIELVPIVLAAGIWGKQWSGKNIMAYCDNEAVVAIVNKGDSREEECMHASNAVSAFFRLLTRDRFVERVRQALTAARIDCKPYSGHSFRIGAATTAAKRGVPPATIQTLGCWESSAYMLYIRVAREELTKISELISRQ